MKIKSQFFAGFFFLGLSACAPGHMNAAPSASDNNASATNPGNTNSSTSPSSPSTGTNGSSSSSTNPSTPPTTGNSAIDWQAWNAQALKISMTFEGGDFANITGNFDGTGLTCGSLGWTLEWDNQQPLVKSFVQQYGIAEAQKLMPQTWSQYWTIIQMADYNQAIQAANAWSHGSVNVDEPYKSELEAFWRDPRMITIQNQAAWVDMGEWAQQQAQIFANDAGVSVSFTHFAYFFDEAVLNGTANVPTVSAAQQVSLSQVWSWMASYTQGYSQDDFQNNRALWPQIIGSASADEVLLFKMGYLRAQLSRAEFEPVTMNRRGTIALHKGYVDGAVVTY